MTPIVRRTSSACLLMSKPPTNAVPAVGGSSVTSIRIRVDLPAPFGTEQAEDFAFFDGEADAVHGGEVAELLDDGADVDGEAHTTGNST